MLRTVPPVHWSRLARSRVSKGWALSWPSPSVLQKYHGAKGLVCAAEGYYTSSHAWRLKSSVLGASAFNSLGSPVLLPLWNLTRRFGGGGCMAGVAKPSELGGTPESLL